MFAEALEKKFTIDNRPNFNNENKCAIENFILGGHMESSFTRGQKLIREFSRKELEGALKDMKGKTLLDSNGSSNKMFKKMGSLAKEKLLTLFNMCLIRKKIPSLWKHSIITMLLKSNCDPKSINSY